MAHFGQFNKSEMLLRMSVFFLLSLNGSIQSILKLSFKLNLIKLKK